MTETAQTILAAPDVLLVTSGDYSDFGVREVLLIPPGRDPKADIAQWNAVWKTLPSHPSPTVTWEIIYQARIALAAQCGIQWGKAHDHTSRILAAWLISTLGYTRVKWFDSQNEGFEDW